MLAIGKVAEGTTSDKRLSALMNICNTKEIEESPTSLILNKIFTPFLKNLIFYLRNRSTAKTRYFGAYQRPKN